VPYGPFLIRTTIVGEAKRTNIKRTSYGTKWVTDLS